MWRQLDHPGEEQVFPERFEAIYVDLLTQVKEKTNATILLMEPTIIEEEVDSEGNQRLVHYAAIVQTFAERFDAIHVPTHQAFIEYLQADADYKLTIDGVHTNSTGNMLMAQTWIKAFEKHVIS